MSQRILHVTLNTGRMTVQRPDAIHPKTLAAPESPAGRAPALAGLAGPLFPV